MCCKSKTHKMSQGAKEVSATLQDMRINVAPVFVLQQSQSVVHGVQQAWRRSV